MSHPNESPTSFCCTCRIPVCRLCLPSHLHGLGSTAEDSLMGIDPPTRATQYAEALSPSLATDLRQAAEKQLGKVETTRKYVRAHDD